MLVNCFQYLNFHSFIILYVLCNNIIDKDIYCLEENLLQIKIKKLKT